MQVAKPINTVSNVGKNAGWQEADASAASSEAALGFPFDADGDAGDDGASERRVRDGDQRVPATARAWGFVRNLQLGQTVRQQSRDVRPAEKDVTLWLDEGRYRFLVAADERIIDDLSPLQFVQFVRQLRHVTSQVLFKYERQPNGSTGRALRVWAA